MEQELTKQDVLELFAETDRHWQARLEQSRQEFEARLAKEAAERKKSRKTFERQLGEIRGTWGRFVEEMVAPNSVELFQQRGIEVAASAQRVQGLKENRPYYQIDLLLLNQHCAIAVEVKSTLQVRDVDEHLERLDKIRQFPPPHIDLTGVSLYGAVAAMIVDQDADVYAIKHGLYVLRQRGNLVEIVNDETFVPKAWQVDPINQDS